jgi:aldehyde dehydrogenase (NAD+)
MHRTLERSAKIVLSGLGIEARNPGGFGGDWLGSGKPQEVVSPVDGETLATVVNVTKGEFDAILGRCHDAFFRWRTVPAPKRGEVVKALGEELRTHKDALARLVARALARSRR